MKFLSLIGFLLLFSEKVQAQTRRTEPILDRRIERVRGKGTVLSAASRTWQTPQVMLTEKPFPNEVAFTIGKIELREEGIEMLNHFIIKIDDDLRKIREQHPSEPLLLKIKIIQSAKTLSQHRTAVIYSYLIERLVQAGNVRIEKEIVSTNHKKNQLSCAISLSSFRENMR
jgi:hypothetical protein